MRRMGIASAFASLALLMAAPPLFAHHAFAAEFDAKKPIHLRGAIRRVEWINPHTWIHVDVKKPDGTVETWMIEAGTPNTLFRRGLTKTSLPLGLDVVVDGYRAFDGALRANGRNITLPDGRQLLLGNSDTGAPRDGK